MISTLPFDVLRAILDTVDDKKTLASCCLVSKMLLDVAQPLLHRSLDVTIREHKDGEASDMAAERGEIYEAYEASYRFLPYLETLKQHPHLKPYVHTFNVSGSRIMDRRGSRIMDGHEFNLIDHPVTSFRQTLQLLPALKNVTLFDPLFLNELDNIIHKLQQNGLEQPAFHLKYLRCPTPEVYNGMLKGSYRSFTTDDHHLVHSVHFGKVFNTVTSVQFHCSSDFGNINLDRFSSVRTLELYATSRRRWVGPPRPLVRHLHNSLARSSTLETVIISGVPSPALIELLSPAGIVGSLPPSVVTLSINAKAGIDTLVRLVQSLPLPTGIETVKTRSAGGDLMQLQQECNNRGIRLMSA